MVKVMDIQDMAAGVILLEYNDIEVCAFAACTHVKWAGRREVLLRRGLRLCRGPGALSLTTRTVLLPPCTTRA
jgi:hypothetical protein